MRPRWRSATPFCMLGVMLAVVLIGCSSAELPQDDASEDAEVAGAVLERDQDGRPAPAADPDDDRDDRSADRGPDEPVTDHLDDPDAHADRDPAADAPSAADDPVARRPAPPPSPSPPAAPAPQPPAPPQPRILSAGLSGPGIALGFGDDDTETSSVTLERDPPPLVSDAVRVEDDDRVACATRLQAPDDRDLVAKGTLQVGLVLDLRDGSAKRVPRQRIELDVHLAAGEVHAFAVSRAFAFDRAALRGAACEAVFQPE